MLFSIVTLCYRAADTLPRTYESLLRQKRSDCEFEWVLVDDFSNDDDSTASMMRHFQRSAPFAVKTVFLEKNYVGSRSAYEGSRVASGDYVLILDQDDMLTDNALEIYRSVLGKYSGTENEKIAGVCGRCQNMQGKFIGTKSKWAEKVSNELEIRHVEKIRGEMFQCTKREIIERFFSDVKPGYSNGYAWTRIAREYDYVYTSSVVRIYNTENSASISHTGKLKYLREDFEMNHYYLNHNYDYLKHDWYYRVRATVRHFRLGLHLGLRKKDLTKILRQELRFHTNILYLLGVLVSFLDRMKGVGVERGG